MRGLRSKHSPFSWSKRTIKVAMTLFYMLAVPAFIIIGLQPAGAANTDNLPQLSIPSIALTTPVEQSQLINRELTVPDRNAAFYTQDPSKTLLIGHSATVFANLKNIKINDSVIYNGDLYHVTDIDQRPKTAISMQDILAPVSKQTIIIMTCAGEPLGDNDYTHRLIVTAE